MASPKTKLKPEWEMFCQYFAVNYETFGNATQAYAKAYHIDLSNKGAYASCRTGGYRLLTNDDILVRVNQLLGELIMNDTTVDMELAFLIAQKHDYSAKIAAIKEYNNLKQRIIKRLELVDPRRDILDKYLGGDDAGQASQVESGSSKDPA